MCFLVPMGIHLGIHRKRMIMLVRPFSASNVWRMGLQESSCRVREQQLNHGAFPHIVAAAASLGRRNLSYLTHDLISAQALAVQAPP